MSDKWIKEFDELYPPKGRAVKYIDVKNLVVSDSIKSFIKQLLKEEREKYAK